METSAACRCCEADEVPDSNAVVPGLIEQRDPERTRLGSDRYVACRWPCGGKRGVESDLGVGVQNAKAVGADDSKRRGARRTEQVSLGIPSGFPDLAEPRGDDHGGLRSRGRTLLEGRRNLRRGDGDHREVDGLREVGDAGIRANPLHFVSACVDRVKPSPRKCRAA